MAAVAEGPDDGDGELSSGGHGGVR
jgi:hypothetical protein